MRKLDSSWANKVISEDTTFERDLIPKFVALLKSQYSEDELKEIKFKNIRKNTSDDTISEYFEYLIDILNGISPEGTKFDTDENDEVWKFEAVRELTFMEQIIEEWKSYQQKVSVKKDDVKVFIINEEKRIGIAESKDFGLIFDDGIEIQEEINWEYMDNKYSLHYLPNKEAPLNFKEYWGHCKLEFLIKYDVLTEDHFLSDDWIKEHGVFKWIRIKV